MKELFFATKADIIYCLARHGVDENPIAYTDDVTPENGLELTFLEDPDGSYRPIKIPGVSMGMFEVPTEGVSIDGKIYLYVTTIS